MEKQSTQQIGATQESDGAPIRDNSSDLAGQVRTWLTVLDIDEPLMTGGKSFDFLYIIKTGSYLNSFEAKSIVMKIFLRTLFLLI